MFNRIRQWRNDVFYDGYERHVLDATGVTLDYIYGKLNDDIYKNRVEEYTISKSKLRHFSRYHAVFYVTSEEWSMVMDILANDERLHKTIISSYGFHGAYYCR